ncbi:MAG: hypothetical protein AB8B56_08055, partial [Crocinitomicaceae bacterium]
LWALLDQKENKEEQWILIDERGKIILSDPVSTTFLVNSGGVVMTENGKIGVFDTDKLRWGIAPIYPCLFESARGFYIAAFSESKKGILRANGTVLLPLEYESIHIFTNEERERDGVTPKKIPQIRWLAKKQQNEILVSQNGDITTSVQEIRLFKESLLFRDTILFDPFRNRLPEAPSMEELRSNNRNNGMSQPIYSIFERSRDHSRSMIHSFPSFDYSNLLIETSDSTQDRVRAARRSFWLNSELKNVVFDSLDLIWKQGLNPCEVNSRNIGAFSNVKSEENLIQEFLQDCECSKHGHVRRVHLWGQGRRYYRLDTIGENFVSITTGYHEAMDVRFQAMSQLPPPPPPAVHLNFIYKEGRAEMMLLRDIFPSDSVLLDEFILALQKRDDLQLECSSLEMMIQMIGGRFSLSDKGIHLYYSNGYDYWSNSVIEFLIPLDRLQLYAESKWIIPILKAS